MPYIFLGFATFDDVIKDRFYATEVRTNYAFQGDGDLWVNYFRDKKEAIKANGQRVNKGDTMTFTLNLDESKIYMSKNGNEDKVIFENIKNGDDIQYKFAVTINSHTTGNRVTMLDVEDLTFISK